MKKVAVIGNGNVALDVARVLAKSADEMAKSDIVPEAGAAIAAAPLTDIHLIGRRGPEQASFTGNELAEMGRLSRAVAVADPAALAVEAPASDPTLERLRKAKNLEILKGFARNVPGSKPITVHFVFNRPTASDRARRIRSGDHLYRLRWRRISRGRGRLSCRAGPGAGRAAPSRPIAPTAMPWRSR